MGGTALMPVCFHATTIAGAVRERLIDKKCGGFAKIDAAKSAGKECAWGADKGSISILDNRIRCVPKGHFENSPAFERRGLTVSQQVPEGRLRRRFFSAVPAGLGVFPTCPGIEMPGYFRWFLRNRTPA
jgi:hypothetical protein